MKPDVFAWKCLPFSRSWQGTWCEGNPSLYKPFSWQCSSVAIIAFIEFWDSIVGRGKAEQQKSVRRKRERLNFTPSHSWFHNKTFAGRTRD